jgi:hypothetical protein
MAQEHNMNLRNEFPTRRRQRSKIAEAVVGVCFTVILMQEGTLKKETKLLNL